MTEIVTTTIPAASRPEAVWTAAPAAPWRRFFARCYDQSLTGIGLHTASVGLLSFVNLEMARGFYRLDAIDGIAPFRTILVIVASFLPMALLLHVSGGSPGKWMFGISVTRADGGRISLRQALRREWLVILRGMAGGLPLACLFFAAKAGMSLKRDGITSWDADVGLQVLYRSPIWSRVGLGVLALAGIIVAQAVLIVCSPMGPYLP